MVHSLCSLFAWMILQPFCLPWSENTFSGGYLLVVQPCGRSQVLPGLGMCIGIMLLLVFNAFYRLWISIDDYKARSVESSSLFTDIEQRQHKPWQKNSLGKLTYLCIPWSLSSLEPNLYAYLR